MERIKVDYVGSVGGAAPVLGGRMVKVELTQGQFALIDDEDLTAVSEHSWCVQQYKNKRRSTKVYAKAAMRGTQVTMHRFLLNPPLGLSVDHINGDGLDNRKSNLRLCTKQGNAANRPKDRIKNATSKYKGVSLVPQSGKWVAKIQVDGKGIQLGCFETEEDAARAYNVAAIEHFGEFAWLNRLP